MNRIYHALCCSIIIGFYSCSSIPTKTLADNKTKVPVNNGVYKNKILFEESLLKVLDTNAIYKGITDASGWTGFYKFYSNGDLNWFYCQNGNAFTEKMFDPDYTGYRGIFYKKKNKIMADLFAEATEWGKIGKLQVEFIIKQDTLFAATRNGQIQYNEIYIKQKDFLQNFIYNRSW